MAIANSSLKININIEESKIPTLKETKNKDCSAYYSTNNFFGIYKNIKMKSKKETKLTIYFPRNYKQNF